MNLAIFDDDKGFISSLLADIEEINKRRNRVFDVALATTNPQNMMDYISENKEQPTIFLIDIVAENRLLGFSLSKKIRELRPNDFIVYITDYPQKIAYNMAEKLNSFCFIIKKSKYFAEELETCLVQANRLISAQDIFVIKSNDRMTRLLQEDIYYFEKIKRSRTVCCVYRNGYTLFSGFLNKIIDELGGNFCFSHKSFIVNRANIKKIDKKNKEIIFENGQKCPYSSFYKGGLF